MFFWASLSELSAVISIDSQELNPADVCTLHRGSLKELVQVHLVLSSVLHHMVVFSAKDSPPTYDAFGYALHAWQNMFSATHASSNASWQMKNIPSNVQQCLEQSWVLDRCCCKMPCLLIINERNRLCRGGLSSQVLCNQLKLR
jgi:hypothetical protein